MPTLGEHLVHEILPPEHRGKGPLSSGKLREVLVDIARKDPTQFPEAVTKLKRLGDDVATLEGISVGLDDVAPHRAERDALLAPHIKAFDAAKSQTEKEKVLVAAQQAMHEYTKRHPGTMGEMARSGGRGDSQQLMRIVAAPVAATDEHDRIVPRLIRRSYAEGLSPADAWVAGNEARINAIKSNISVVEPGDLAKILVNNMSDQLVTSPDCNTKNGIVMSTKDAHVADRYLAHAAGAFSAGTLITPQVRQALERTQQTVVVRSPMTCEAPHGLCQKCRGLDPAGRLFTIGTNVGLRSAQAMAEPLTQLALSAKHGGALAKADSDEKKLTGLKGVRQILEIPESFLHKATLAQHDGEVKKVDSAPQGGHYIWVNDTRHYVGPDLKVKVGIGHKVEAGDALSNGVPKPDEIVHHKGLGEGRHYLVNQLHDIYADNGVQLDKRHFETLARTLLNHVQVTHVPDESDTDLVRGDVVDYNRYKTAIADSHKTMSLPDAVGETLATDVLHFTAGTRITPSVQATLERQAIKTVPVAMHAPTVTPVMRTAQRNPLLNPDWMARLAHRYLRESLIGGAHRGDVSDVHGTHPVSAYAAGTEFGTGPGGLY